ncbi:hypothetical protein DUI87_30807 [Hirundo rustica rustica]|uniref:Uncharacterized protein n=1 Tax=Hirundo rustica rustica TaxID=333673 RepID=A0A3M0IVC4_HIRRU|nr:hypothetical protein DUI87_30807 [Hirundo rustica rustica]
MFLGAEEGWMRVQLQPGQGVRIVQEESQGLEEDTSLALHPRKRIVLSCGDDRLWKTWGFPDGNILLTGEGHTDWLSGCCFRPSGTQLVTSSGDTTVRIWDLSRRGCILTLRGHSRAVRGCSWHSCGDFVASASMDGTSKIWDVNSERCRYTLRGHEDSVNSIEFLPFSSTALTSSADKTLSLWDVRTVNNAVVPKAAVVEKSRSWQPYQVPVIQALLSWKWLLCFAKGLRVFTFQGHAHSCNHATFNKKIQLLCVAAQPCARGFDVGRGTEAMPLFPPLQGDTIASCDSSGVMKLWDMRKLLPILSIDAGPHPANQVTFHRSVKVTLDGKRIL